MIGIADTAEDIEQRNSEGFPVVEANVPDNRGNFHQQVDQSRGKNDALPWMVLIAVVSCSLAGTSLGLSIGAFNEARKSERESRLQRLETDELKAAVVRSGIKIHLESDSP